MVRTRDHDRSHRAAIHYLLAVECSSRHDPGQHRRKDNEREHDHEDIGDLLEHDNPPVVEIIRGWVTGWAQNMRDNLFREEKPGMSTAYSYDLSRFIE
jgi:hypothetical protein